MARAQMLRYTCATCGEVHEGVPSLGARAPLYYYAIPEAERGSRCELDSDTCVIDDRIHFVRGCIEVPIIQEDHPFVWGVWVSLSPANFETFTQLLEHERRSHFGPFFGWLSASFRGYPESENLKTMVHLRDEGLRPLVELEPTEHPLAVEQRTGISQSRVVQILSAYAHPDPLSGPAA